MGRLFGAVTLPNIISRHRELALTDNLLIDGTIHYEDKILEGTLLVQATAGGSPNSKWVAYSEGVASAAAANTQAAIALDPTQVPRAAQWFRPGMPVAKVHAGVVTSLGTVLVYNPATGAMVLTANLAAAVAQGDSIILDPAVYPIAYNKARVLVDETLMDENDQVATGFFKGFFNQAATSITTYAAAQLGAVVINSGIGELEIK